MLPNRPLYFQTSFLQPSPPAQFLYRIRHILCPHFSRGSCIFNDYCSGIIHIILIFRISCLYQSVAAVIVMVFPLDSVRFMIFPLSSYSHSDIAVLNRCFLFLNNLSRIIFHDLLVSAIYNFYLYHNPNNSIIISNTIIPHILIHTILSNRFIFSFSLPIFLKLTAPP